MQMSAPGQSARLMLDVADVLAVQGIPTRSSVPSFGRLSSMLVMTSIFGRAIPTTRFLRFLRSATGTTGVSIC